MAGSHWFRPPYGVWPLAAVLAALGLPTSAAAQQTCPDEVARFDVVRNSVQLVQVATGAPLPAAVEGYVCDGDTIRVGPSSRAVIVTLLTNKAISIDQNTDVVIHTPQPDGTSIIDLVRGALVYFSRVRRATEIRTPFVNASVEGTEFVVRVLTDRAVITVFDGTVRATNPLGTVLVGPGQQAVAVQGQPPQIELVIRPRDAVQWALHYEPILPADSFEQLATIPDTDRDAGFYVRRASLQLGVGQLEAARADLEQALALDPSSGDVYVLRTVAAIALNDRQGALEHARTAVALTPASAPSHLALSYALQADFQLDAARDAAASAVALHPDSGAAWARLAEVRLMLNDIPGAAVAARRAVSTAPDLARAQAALGFALLAESRPSAARTAFEQAIAAAPDNPLARLGLGLTRISQGDLSEGRAQLELAVALDPDNALYRSYLGKAFAEAGDDELATREFELAALLDPLDPTPAFYDAILQHARHRPIAALHSLQQSIGLNDNRAVYRSRLLLESDLAIRGARLGRIYRDLGFEHLALLEGAKSLAVAMSNHSAHRLLADGYVALPRHQIARDSELLQAQLLQPVNINPVQALLADHTWMFMNDAWISGVGFNEFTPLFARDTIRLTADALVGGQATGGHNLIASGLLNRLSYSAGHFGFRSDGIRRNHDVTQDLYNVFVQGAITPRTSAQMEIRGADTRTGDRRLLFFDPYLWPDQRSLLETASVRLGGRHTLSPGSTLIGSYTHRTLESSFDSGDDFLQWLQDERARFGELRYLHEAGRVDVTAGVGLYRGDRLETLVFGPFSPPPTTYPVSHTNAYAYTDIRLAQPLTLTVGASHDDFQDGPLLRTAVNPKLGLTWVAGTTTVRAAAFRAFERTLITGQTLEPTNLAGFNQFFVDGNAAESWRYGIALDRQLPGPAFTGLELSFRTISVPAFEGITDTVIELPSEELLARAYVHAVPTGHLALTAQYQFDRLTGDSTGNNTSLLARSTIHRASGESRVFLDAGFFATARLSRASQNGHFQAQPQMVLPGRTAFWVLDGSIGWRLRRYRATVALEARNATDAMFRFQDVAPPQPLLVPGRLVTLRASFAL